MGGGLVVGMTPVGSGSLVIIALMFLYAKLQATQLVGTDLVQTVPLVASAALGHLIFGDFQLAVAVPLLIGSIPGAVLGHTRIAATIRKIKNSPPLLQIILGLDTSPQNFP